METTSRSPKWIKPQLTCLVDEAPTGNDWVHEIKYDGYRMHARIDGRDIKLLTRTGLDWSHRYKRTIEAIRFLKVKRRAGGLNSPPTHRRYDDGR